MKLKRPKIKRIMAGAAALLALLYAALAVYATWPVNELPAKTFAAEDDHFITVNSVTIRYKESGEKGKPTILLVHGFAGSVYTYRHLIPLLEQDFHVFAIDLPGFGLSDKPGDYDYGYQNQGSTIRSFIHQMALEEVNLVGHSMGGNIILYAGTDNSDVSKMIFLDPGIIDDGNPAFISWLFFPFTHLSAKLFRDADFRRSSLVNSYHRPEKLSQQDIDAYMVASKTENFVNAMVAMLKNYNKPNESALTRLADKPALLLWGEFDKGNPPQNGEYLLDMFPDAEFQLIHDAGHYIHEEQPEVTAGHIRAFLAQ